MRFDILEPSGLSNKGKWANWGGVNLKQAYRSKCNGREGSHSCELLGECQNTTAAIVLTSPRSTCVIPIWLSSTTEARWYVGNESDLSKIGSVGRDRRASRISPNIRSSGVGLSGTNESYKIHSGKITIRQFGWTNHMKANGKFLSRSNTTSNFLFSEVQTSPIICHQGTHLH